MSTSQRVRGVVFESMRHALLYYHHRRRSMTTTSWSKPAKDRSLSIDSQRRQGACSRPASRSPAVSTTPSWQSRPSPAVGRSQVPRARGRWREHARPPWAGVARGGPWALNDLCQDLHRRRLKAASSGCRGARVPCRDRRICRGSTWSTASCARRWAQARPRRVPPARRSAFVTFAQMTDSIHLDRERLSCWRGSMYSWGTSAEAKLPADARSSFIDPRRYE